jgi:protoporphyrinogen oxidase
VLVALFLDKASVGRSATVYFPDPLYRFTRVSEPRNRSASMAPPGRTSLVAELPCDCGDGTWGSADAALAEDVVAPLTELGWFSRAEVSGFTVRRIRHAYPVLTLSLEASLAQVLDYLSAFTNLTVGGRSGAFAYTHLHDMLRFGREAVRERVGTARRAGGRAPRVTARHPDTTCHPEP